MVYEIGKLTSKLFLIVFPIIIAIALDVKNQKRLPLIALFIFGWMVYVIPMELRPYFRGNHFVLFWFGIIPNFGCAFALPIIGLKKKPITYIAAKNRLLISSFIAFGILFAYESVEMIKGFGTFDWLDIAMSILGLILVNILFNSLQSIFKPAFEDNQIQH